MDPHQNGKWFWARGSVLSPVRFGTFIHDLEAGLERFQGKFSDETN